MSASASSEHPGGERCLGSVAQVPVGEGRLFDVDGWRVAVFRLRNGAVRAIEPGCPHRGGPLAEGLTGETMVICPLHGWTFDLVTGCRVGGTEAVVCYQARVADGQLVISGPSVPA